MTENKYEPLLNRIKEIRQEGDKLREELVANPSRHGVVEAKLEQLEEELVKCTQKFLELADLVGEFDKFQQGN